MGTAFVETWVNDSEQVLEVRRRGFPIHGLGRFPPELVIQSPSGLLVIHRNACGDAQHIFSDFDRNHHHPVPVAADNVAGPNQDTAAAHRRSHVHEFHAAGDDGASNPAAGHRVPLQNDLVIQYFLRCPFSQARMIEVTEAGKVIYKTEHNAVGRFPEPGDGELLAGPSRNFQVFDPLDFLAEVTQHIPESGEHLIRYYGWYSNKTRGQRHQRQRPAAVGAGAAARSPSAPEARKGWAALIRQVYETDPLCCPKCGSTMRIVSFIERRQTEVIEKILRHCGRWEECPARGPPVLAGPVED